METIFYSQLVPEIMIIDDDENICDSLSIVIDEIGYRSIAFQDHVKAWEYFQIAQNPIVLLDINLTNKSGLEILPKFKNLCENTQVIMMTGEREIRSVVSSLMNRASDFWFKPLQLANIEFSIQRALNHYQVLREKEKQEETLLRDLRVASKIQKQVLLVPELSPHRCLVDLIPAFFVSGDFYQIQRLPQERIFMLLGDIEDHGVTSGLIAFMMINLIREFLHESSDLSLLFQTMNETLLKEIGAHSMTAVGVVVDTSQHKIQFVRGGHPFPLLFKKSTGKLEFLNDRSGTLLGILENIEFPLYERIYESGDILLIYSDGLIYSMTSPLLTQLKDCFNEKDPLIAIESRIKKHIQSEQKNGTAIDDISYILFEF